jgi:2-dehydro-3-deoxyphosphogluconate aldolase / (4S)-4-hydroxy-2-oxoglutarate aldolase
VIDDASKSVPLARALLEGGVGAMELTLRTDASMESLHRIRTEVPAMLVGCGTVLNTNQVDQILSAGAAFGVAPGLNPRIVRHAIDRGLPFAPGVVTPSEVELAIELGCRLLKFFPAEPSGGLDYLRVMAAPFRHLGVQFLPLGGLSTKNAATYLEERGLIAAIGGSWLAPKSALDEGNWELIRRLAREASELARKVRAS